MEDFVTLQQIDETVAAIRQKTSQMPRIGLVLGSGLGDLADSVEQAERIPYSQLPNWPVSTIMGHKGTLVIGKLAAQSVVVMQGRTHYYEGYSMGHVTFPIRVMQRLGIEILIVTNAAGAINPDFIPGEVMLIVDQLNLIGMGGLNPLRGPNLAEFGERFPDMSQPFDRELMTLARKAAGEQLVTLREGIYVGLAGPSFESPADLRFLRLAGADAVGMSTVAEVVVARHGKTRVLGFSGISNKANLDGSTITTHVEVLEAGKVIVPRLRSIILGVLYQL